MRILFIGGTGIISQACTWLCVEAGYDVCLLRRGRTERPLPPKIRQFTADIRDRESSARVLRGQRFDCVVDFVAFKPEHIATDIQLFGDKTSQFVFISSASVYDKPPSHLPIAESTPLNNRFWQYSRDKIACEARLTAAYAEGFPATIVRPSHTYDETTVPCEGGYTVIERMRNGKPVVVHGDGTSLWVLTHHRDFAKGLIGLLGNPAALGHSFHITSDEWLSWNQIYEMLGNAVGARPKLVHVPSWEIAEQDSNWGAGLFGDKMHSMVFDNTKIKRFVPGFEATIPFFLGAREIARYFERNPSEKRIDLKFDRLTDQLVEKWAPTSV